MSEQFMKIWLVSCVVVFLVSPFLVSAAGVPVFSGNCPTVATALNFSAYAASGTPVFLRVQNNGSNGTYFFWPGDDIDAPQSNIGTNAVVITDLETNDYTFVAVPVSPTSSVNWKCAITRATTLHLYYTATSSSSSGGSSTSTSATSTTYIDNPSLNTFLGLVMFLATMWFIVFVFKKR